MSFRIIFHAIGSTRSTFTLLVYDFFVLLGFCGHFAGGCPTRIYLVSRKIVFGPLSSTLREVVRFLHGPLPTPRSTFLTVNLPT